MKRRSMAATIRSRPIEFWPHRFFLLVIREPPHLSLRPSESPLPPPPPLHLPCTPGIEFVEFKAALLEPRGSETGLDTAHTIRFCRFLNTMRRQHDTTTSTIVGRPHQVHFVIRSHEAAVVQLVVRWRLLCLQLSPADALAPFAPLPWLVVSELAGIAKGVANDLLISSHEFQSNEDDDKDLKSDRDSSNHDAGFIRITTRFLLFAGPTNTESERPATVDNTSSKDSTARLSVAQLVPQLTQHRVAMVVKLNTSPQYDDQLIIRSGIDHLDLSNQSDADGVDRTIIARFLESCEHSAPPRIVAVHSSTGRGRAAFCIACFLIKHAQFSPSEAIGWLRFCCPGSLPLTYARQLQQMETALSRDGDEYRRRLAVVDERPRGSFSRLSLKLTLDDLAFTSSQISLGQIALGRESLLGTAKDKPLSPPKKPVSPAAIVPVQRSAGGSFRELIASDAVLGLQAARRPLTQGSSTTRRRLLDHHTHHGSFATLHKFLHPSSGPSQRSTATAPTTTRSGVHVRLSQTSTLD